MAAEGLAMRKILEILRLKFELKQSNRVVARSAGCARSTVSDYVSRAHQHGLDSWEKIAPLTEVDLAQRLFKKATNVFGTASLELNSARPLPDWNEINLELKRPGVTLELLWQEYREEFTNGLGRTQFCQHYASFKKKLSCVMRQDHKAGEKCFVDYSGNGINIVDPRTGEIQKCELFVGVLGASSYTFAYATPSQDLASWLLAHVKMYEFFNGVSELTVPDNLKSGVTKTCRYDPELNRSYHDLAQHYGTCVMPARPYHPRDKAKVEVAVLVVQRWILAVLRKKTFHSICEVNAAIRDCLTKINSKIMRHMKKSRFELYCEIDRPALKKLPAHAFELALWKKARLNIDYHLTFEDHYYSAPFTLVHKELWIRATDSILEIFHQNTRVASHQRSYIKFKATTLPEHMPKAHQQYAEWTPSRIIGWAQKFGPHCAKLVSEILDSKAHPELGYRAALGIVRLQTKFGAERLNKACSKALQMGSPCYQSVQSILKNNAENSELPGQIPIPITPAPKNSAQNLRGANYFN
jgi:transposase